jgi:hypothetical protein
MEATGHVRIQYRNLPAGTEEIYEKSVTQDRDSNTEHREYGVLTTTSRRSEII